ncbi:MAG TPA: sulfur carrier protein ThiS [Micromonosporaceae bacterium]|jgi:sulfur carrier protein
MQLTVNGEVTEVRDGATLADLVASRLRSDKGVAAAIDGEVAPKTTWPAVVLADGQAVELLTAVQGG